MVPQPYTVGVDLGAGARSCPMCPGVCRLISDEIGAALFSTVSVVVTVVHRFEFSFDVVGRAGKTGISEYPFGLWGGVMVQAVGGVGPPGGVDAGVWVKLAAVAGDEAGLLDALGSGRGEVDAVAEIVGMVRLVHALHGRVLGRVAGLVAGRERVIAAGQAGVRHAAPAVALATDQVATELALELRLPPGQAGGLVSDALSLRDRLPATRAALGCGAIGPEHVDKILGEESRLVDKAKHTPEFDRRMAAFAATNTPGRTRREAARLVVELEPEQAQKREQAAIERRGVEFAPLEDGMGRLVAELPAPDLAAIREVLDRAADRALRGGDGRTVHQLRADLLADWATAALAAEHALPGHCAGCRCDGRGDDARNGTGRPGLGRLAGPRGRGLPFLRITIAAGSLAALGDLPAELAGSGAITADWVRRLIACLLAREGQVPAELVAVDATGRPVTPVQGKDDSYRPRAATARAVRGRDGTCRNPVCTRPARYADLDHTIPWDGHPDGVGPTHPANLAALCRGHHQEKTRGLWELAHRITDRPELTDTGYEATGELTITTSTGRTYTTRPDPLPHREVERQESEDDPAPF